MIRAKKTQVICLMGPTATGKTELATALLDNLNCQLISVDSAQIYRDMNIGTAKPSADELRAAPHRLIDILDPSDSYSAAQFRSDALAQMAEIVADDNVPVLVGGTMLYFKVLRDGIANMPAADPQVRSQIAEQASLEGWDRLHRELQAVDSIAANRIHPNNPQRLMRALEVFRLTGRPISDFWHEQKQQVDSLPYQFHFFSPEMPSHNIYQSKIEARFRQMLKDGFIEEVQMLKSRPDIHRELPSMRCVGYRQVWDYLEGDLNYDEMIERGVIATRQLAKRQLTWLRAWDDLEWLSGHYAKKLKNLLKFSAQTSL